MLERVQQLQRCAGFRPADCLAVGSTVVAGLTGTGRAVASDGNKAERSGEEDRVAHEVQGFHPSLHG